MARSSPPTTRTIPCVKNAMSADGGLGIDYGQIWINTIDQIIDIFMQNFNLPAAQADLPGLYAQLRQVPTRSATPRSTAPASTTWASSPAASTPTRPVSSMPGRLSPTRLAARNGIPSPTGTTARRRPSPSPSSRTATCCPTWTTSIGACSTPSTSIRTI